MKASIASSPSEIGSFTLMSFAPGRVFNPDQPVSGADAMRYLDLILALIQ